MFKNNIVTYSIVSVIIFCFRAIYYHSEKCYHIESSAQIDKYLYQLFSNESGPNQRELTCNVINEILKIFYSRRDSRIHLILT